MRRAVLALSLLALGPSCAEVPLPQPPRWPPPRSSACEVQVSRVRTALTSSPPRCSADEECEPFLRHFLGCESWAPRSFELGAALPALEDACASSGFQPACAPALGVCREGRCASRPPLRQVPCAGVRTVLAARLAEASTCAADTDCEVAFEPGRATAAPAGYEARFAADLRAIQDNCRDGEALIAEGGSGPVAVACLERRCVIGPPSEGRSGLGAVTPPRLLEPGCVSRQLRLPAPLGLPSQTTAKFYVSARGVPQAFSFKPDDAPESLRLAIAGAVTSCGWAPASRGGKFTPRWVWIPLKFGR